MTEPLRTNDYFDVEDVVAAGPEAWSKVRKHAKAFGFNVSNNYGCFDRLSAIVNTGNKYVVGIDSDGDFLSACEAVETFKGGRRRTMAEFVSKMPCVKIRVGGDRVIMALAVDELRRRGYKDGKYTEQHLPAAIFIVGVIGDSDGTIILSASNMEFDRKYWDVDELLYDVNRVITLDNIRVKRVKPKLVNVSGVMCNKDDLDAFLESQRQANPQ